MDLQIDTLANSISTININKTNTITNIHDTRYSNKIKKIIKIQSWFRGCIYRLKHLPLIMYKIQKFTKELMFKCSTLNSDGRDNSKIDEKNLIPLLIKKFDKRIVQAADRFWYDILAYDYTYGWIPINIKTTTTEKNDNVGNLSICVYSYTDGKLDIHRKQNYDNGKMSIILFNKIKDKQYNKLNKKDYYFLVINKKNPSDIIINSVKGLTTLTSNLNNLPFQICWKKNKEFKYENINKKIELFIQCLQKPKPSWSEKFMKNIRTIEL